MSIEKQTKCDRGQGFGTCTFILSLMGCSIIVSEAAVRETVSLPAFSQSSSLNVTGKDSSDFFFFDDRSKFGVPLDEGSSFSVSRALIAWDLRKIPEDATFVNATVTVGGNRVASETSSVAPKTIGFYLFDGDYANFVATSEELKFGELGLYSTSLGSVNVKPSTVPVFSKEIQLSNSQLSREVLGVVFRSDETNDPDQDDRHTYSATLPTMQVTYDVPEQLKVTGVRQVGHEGGQHTYRVISNVDWLLTESSPWLSPDVNSGTGDYTGEVVLDANPTGNPRTATLTFTGGGLTTTFSITQAGIPPILEIDDSSESFDWLGESHFFEVTSDSTWSFITSENWITTGEASTQSGNQRFTYLVTGNSLETPRSGTITFTSRSVSRTHTVTQGGVEPHIILNGPTGGFDAQGGPGAIIVGSNVSWDYTTSADWIVTFQEISQSGNQVFTYGVESNPTESSRTGTITFTNGPNGLSETHTITQEGMVFVLELTDPKSGILSTLGILKGDVHSISKWDHLNRQLREDFPEGVNFAELEQLQPDAGSFPKDKEPTTSARRLIMKQWAESDLDGAADYVLQNPERLAPKMMQTLTGWAKFKTPEDAMTWVRGLEEGPYFDQAALGLLRHLRYGTLEQAKELAGQIGDLKLRAEGAAMVDPARFREKGG